MAKEAEKNKIIFIMLKSDLEKKANFTFYQILGIGASFFALLLFLSLKLYPKLFLLWESFLGKLEFICGCANHLSFTNHPTLFTSLISLGLGVAAFFSFVIIKIIKFKWLTNEFIKTNLKNKKQAISQRLEKVSRTIGLENQIIEVKNQKPIIFCFGLIKPRVCISSGFIRKLSNKELKAVLMHEQYHLINNEPIRIFVVKLITKILFFLPGLKSFSRQYLTFSELAADQWATNNFKDKTSLAGALYKVIRWKKQMIAKNELALSFFANPAMEERVNKLVDNKYKPKFRIFTPKLSIGIALLVFSFIILSGVFSPNSSAMAGHDTAYCLGMESESISQQQCEMSLKRSVCNMSYSLETPLCEN